MKLHVERHYFTLSLQFQVARSATTPTCVVYSFPPLYGSSFSPSQAGHSASSRTTLLHRKVKTAVCQRSRTVPRSRSSSCTSYRACVADCIGRGPCAPESCSVALFDVRIGGREDRSGLRSRLIVVVERRYVVTVNMFNQQAFLRFTLSPALLGLTSCMALVSVQRRCYKPVIGMALASLRKGAEPSDAYSHVQKKMSQVCRGSAG